MAPRRHLSPRQDQVLQLFTCRNLLMLSQSVFSVLLSAAWQHVQKAAQAALAFGFFSGHRITFCTRLAAHGLTFLLANIKVGRCIRASVAIEHRKDVDATRKSTRNNESKGPVNFPPMLYHGPGPRPDEEVWPETGWRSSGGYTHPLALRGSARPGSPYRPSVWSYAGGPSWRGLIPESETKKTLVPLSLEVLKQVLYMGMTGYGQSDQGIRLEVTTLWCPVSQ